MKKKNRTYRITSIALALLMFFTSTGFSIDTHYCGGKLKSTSFFGKAPTCHEQEKSTAPTCPHHQAMDEANDNGAVSKRDCCKNEMQYFQLDQDQQNLTSAVPTSEIFSLVLAVFSVVLFQEITIDSTLSNSFDYPPLIGSREFYVLFEAFLL